MKMIITVIKINIISISALKKEFKRVSRNFEVERRRSNRKLQLN